MADELTCAALDGVLWIPCGFPAAVTVRVDGVVVGICRTHIAPAVYAGHHVHPLPQQPTGSEPGS